MILLQRLFTKSEATQPKPRPSRMAREATLELLRREIAATVHIDPERAAEIARAKLARLGAVAR